MTVQETFWIIISVNTFFMLLVSWFLQNKIEKVERRINKKIKDANDGIFTTIIKGPISDVFDKTDEIEKRLNTSKVLELEKLEKDINKLQNKRKRLK